MCRPASPRTPHEWVRTRARTRGRRDHTDMKGLLEFSLPPPVRGLAIAIPLAFIAVRRHAGGAARAYGPPSARWRLPSGGGCAAVAVIDHGLLERGDGRAYADEHLPLPVADPTAPVRPARRGARGRGPAAREARRAARCGEAPDQRVTGGYRIFQCFLRRCVFSRRHAFDTCAAVRGRSALLHDAQVRPRCAGRMTMDVRRTRFRAQTGAAFARSV
jgi:hypothetical protein